MTRTLPLRVIPGPGEALDSWLEAVAIRYDLSLGEITRAVGIPHSVRPRWMTKLAHRELQSLSLTTGLSSECFESMTLNHFHQAALEVDHLSGHLVSTFPWGVTYRSRYCPHCLRESGGRWQLAWRLKWSYLCTVHRCLLVDQCPQCQNNQRTRAAFLMATPRLGRCTATQKSPDCDGDLRDAQTLQLPAAHPAVVAQQRVYDVIAQRCASFGVYAEDSAVARGFLSDLRALASRVLAHAKCNGVTDTSDEELIATYLDQQPPRAAAWLGRQYTSSKEPPKTAAETAVSITAALKILGAETIADAAAAMKWLVPPCGAGQKPAGFSAGLHASPIGAAIYIKAFSTELGPALQLRHRSNLAIPGAKRTDPAIAELLARRIPPMLWPAWAVRVQPRGAHKSAVPQCLSCAAVLAATRITVARAAELLGGNLNVWTLTGNLNVLRRDPQWAAISIALTRLADYLSAHAPPIDYNRRRNLDYSRLLATADWHRICAAAGMPPGGPSTAHVARIALSAKISGLPPEKFLTACKPEVRHGLLYRVRDLPLHLSPPLLHGLDNAGRLLLDMHHIDEPLTWQPPLRLLEGLDLPNTDVHRVDIDVLHSLAAKPRATARSIAAALGTDPDVVRHLLAEQPVDAHQTRAENPASMKSGPARARLRHDLTADQLRAMHHVEGKSGFAIAREIGVSYKVLRTLATSYGITFGYHPQRPTPEWLRGQYVVKRRALVDIAKELNVCALTVSGWVHRDGLPSAPRATPEAAQPVSATEMADLLAPALARRAGRRQLENFLLALNHPNLTAAAARCGIDHSTLWYQIRQLEKDFGGPLLLRAHMPLLSMAPTALGIKVAAAAKAVHHEAQGQRP
ncbi:TniQ family protein [Mycolicibacterium pyrenivorans]|uniref:TniQ family protein n=1 Tax=Mycolicibacterium pyrenivorans TaxID=187102 RepID=UPI0021F2C77D|nr:TniQ family protein [Mycolicibacterium pyrenivorans]MCV7153308.1 TniQ family protein [Mycolicibacterium pyrenivorans]